MSKVSNCPCGASNSYKLCCQKYHNGQNPKTALLLMKSRYCAFARGEVDYIVKTTHPKNPALQNDVSKWRCELQEFSKNTQFKGLKILEVKEAELNEKATVTFCVDLIQYGRQAGFTEKSTFEKVNGRWLYLDGVIQSPVEAELQGESDFSL
ncbi:MAG: YchJ family metal-binding protein [Candidatus Melainabacteria bacterium]|nr:YchJ family metal-binding protein [Candidatus Melainabacteria bacterium]